jgi:hypothetical protein
MSIFTKQVSQLERADLEVLISDKAVESARLEFKLEIPNKDETLKKFSSFGNTFGGFIVVGARADSKDGRIENLPGVAVEAGYKQNLTQWCFDAVSPPMTVEVSDPIPVSTEVGKVSINGRKGVLVRTYEFSSRFEAHLGEDR